MIKLMMFSGWVLFSSFAVSGSVDPIFRGHLDLMPSLHLFFLKAVETTQELYEKIEKQSSLFFNLLKRRKSFEQLLKERRKKIRDLMGRSSVESLEYSKEDSLSELAELLSDSNLNLIEDLPEENSPVYETPIACPTGKKIEQSIFKILQTVEEKPSKEQASSGQDSISDPKEEWGGRSEQWSGSVGTDLNRIHLINPIIKRFCRNVIDNHPLPVIGDIGCGNACLSVMLRDDFREADYGACIVGIDCTEMIQVARIECPWTPSIDLREGTASRLSSIENDGLNAAIYNFVLQDCEHLERSVNQLFRVLREDGLAIITIPHSAFPGVYRETMPNGNQIYTWKKSYLEEHVQKVAQLLGEEYDPPIQVFSRPISRYLQTFIELGFEIKEYIEPYLSDEKKQTLNDMEIKALDSKNPITAVFIIRKKTKVEIEMDRHLLACQKEFERTQSKGISRTFLAVRIEISFLNGIKVELTESHVEKMFKVGKWTSKQHFLETCVVPMSQSSLLVYLPVCAVMNVSISELRSINVFENLSKCLKVYEIAICVVQHPCFPGCYEVKKADVQFNWSNYYHVSHFLSDYLKAIFESGLMLVGVLEVSCPLIEDSEK